MRVNTLIVMVLSAVSPGGGGGVERVVGDVTELLVAAGTAGVDDGIIITIVEEEHS